MSGKGESSTARAEPKYDVAISFLKENLALAERIRDGLMDRLTTAAFVYSREQPEVVGSHTDGVEAFTSLFRDESRVCVVLHSDGWGRKGYTHIEQSAMRERVPKEGYDFLLVVTLDKAQPPKWIPSNNIWYDYKQYGFDGLLAAISNRVTLLGGRPKADPLLEKAARLERERAFTHRKELFARSSEGFELAQQEVTTLYNLLENRVQALAQASPVLELSFAKNSAHYRSAAAVSKGASFVLYWQPEYTNSLTNAALLIVEWGGRFMYAGGGGGPPKLGSLRATPTLDYAGGVVWQLVEGKREPLTSEKLIDYLSERLLNHSHQKAGSQSSGPSYYIGGSNDFISQARREQQRDLQNMIDNDWRF